MPLYPQGPIVDPNNYETLNASTFTVDEQIQILAECAAIDIQIIHIQQHLDTVGTVVPMRTLGHWEEMRLDQRAIVFEECAKARRVATHWPMEV